MTKVIVAVFDVLDIAPLKPGQKRHSCRAYSVVASSAAVAKGAVCDQEEIGEDHLVFVNDGIQYDGKNALVRGPNSVFLLSQETVAKMRGEQPKEQDA